MRWRADWLRQTVTRARWEALSFLPTGLQLIWNAGPLRGNTAPGIVRGSVRRRACAELCRAFKLPPATAYARRHPLIEGVVARPTAPGLVSVKLLLGRTLDAPERKLVEERVAALNTLVEPRGVRVDVGHASDVPHDELAVWLTYGALLSGQLPEDWATRANTISPTPSCVERLVTLAPSRLCATLPFLLLHERPAFTCGPTMRLDGQAAGWGAWGNRAYADPELMLANWVARDEDLTVLAHQAVLAGSARPATRGIAAEILGTLAGDPFSFVGKPKDGAYRHWKVVDRISSLAARALLRVPRAERGGLRGLLRDEVRMHGVPRAFLPTLRAGLLEAWPTGPGRLFRRRMGRKVELLTANGLVLGQGRSLATIQARAIARLAGAGSRLTPLHTMASWTSRLATRLEEPVTGPTSIFYLRARPGTKGARGQSLGRATWVRLHPFRRPVVRQLHAGELLGMLVRSLRAADGVELVALKPEAHPLQAALTRLCATFAAGRAEALLFGDGARAWLINEKRVRQPHVERACRRPRRASWTSDAQPPGALPNGPSRSSRSSPPRIQCEGALAADGTHASLVWTDEAGRRLTESVPLEELSAFLDETDELLRALPLPALLWTRLPPELTALAVRRRDGNRPKARLEVEGTLPFGLRVKVGGEWFGVGCAYPLEGAAQVLLADWPAGVEGTLCFDRLSLPDAAPVLVLYARSVIRRRLQLRLRKLEGLNGSDGRAETFW